MFDEKFLRRFNAESPNRPYTMEEVIRMFESMPSQRVGALFDFVRWVKKDAANASRAILINNRMRALPPKPREAQSAI